MRTNQVKNYEINKFANLQKNLHISFCGLDNPNYEIIQIKKYIPTCAYCGTKMATHKQIEERLKALMGLSCEEFQAELARTKAQYPKKYTEVLDLISRTTPDEANLVNENHFLQQISSLDSQISIEEDGLKKQGTYLETLRKVGNEQTFTPNEHGIFALNRKKMDD